MRFLAARRSIVSLLMGVVLTLALALPVFAFQEEDGTKTCSFDFIGYIHVRYYHYLGYISPGYGSVRYDLPYDSAWHIVEHNGVGGGGYWYTVALNLDFANTWAACRNYG
jgi:hypothetical protein